MRLLNTTSLELHEFESNNVPKYAILSHRWQDEEVTFRHQQDGLAQIRKGWSKITNFCRIARTDGLEWAWVDTCCIDKSSSAELSEAINSMFVWYQNSAFCYVYLSDVDTTETVRNSKWFTRSWTLQELIAPIALKFYSCSWRYLGTKEELSEEITAAAGFSLELHNLEVCSIAQRMSWAASRKCTRGEDRAYSLLGLFDINMPLLYGEGEEKAFLRLQLEIIQRSDDESIFAWVADGSRSGLLANKVDDFQASGNIERISFFDREEYAMGNRGLRVQTTLAPFYPEGPNGVIYQCMPLNCTRSPYGRLFGASEARPLSIFLVPRREDDRQNYCRVGPLEFFPFDLKILAQNPVTIRVRQRDRLHWIRGYGGYHSQYIHPNYRRTTQNLAAVDPKWHIRKPF